MPDQVEMWNQKHTSQEHEKLREKPSPLASLAISYFPEKSNILELGCGVARDSIFFAKNGHTVLATDGSDVVIKQNNKKSKHQFVRFLVLDVQKDLGKLKQRFDVVYSNLSLHYFYDEQTREIIKNIHSSLKPDGVLAFSCKARDDFRTREAQELEKNLFVAKNGHALRLFSEEYARDITKDLFRVEYLDTETEEYLGRTSDIVRFVGMKK